MAQQTPASVLLDSVLKSEILPLLEGDGFQKLGKSLVCSTKDSYSIVWFQVSNWSMPDLSRFTVNLRWTFPKWHLSFKPGSFPKNPAMAVPVFSLGIGSFMGPKVDPWWVLKVGQPNGESVEHLRSTMVQHALPFVRSLPLTEELLAVARLQQAEWQYMGKRGLTSMQAALNLYHGHSELAADVLLASVPESMLGTPSAATTSRAAAAMRES